MWRKGRSGRCGIKGVAAKLCSRYRRFAMNYAVIHTSTSRYLYLEHAMLNAVYPIIRPKLRARWAGMYYGCDRYVR
jgi:hypothetical protein